MKRIVYFISLFLVVAISINAQETEFTELTGPYLGQKPPVNDPVIFAPEIISNGRNHSSVAISPDGKELYWSGVKGKIWFTKLESGRWKIPEVVSFCKEDSNEYDNPFITTDGKNVLYFIPSRSCFAEQRDNLVCRKISIGMVGSQTDQFGSKRNAFTLEYFRI
jgi:hypothetical protein